MQEQRHDHDVLQQRYDEQRLETTELRRQLDEMKLIVDDNTTELELRRANDSLSVLRNQLDNSEKQVRVHGSQPDSRRSQDFVLLAMTRPSDRAGLMYTITRF